jgi:hypothetical protein
LNFENFLTQRDYFTEPSLTAAGAAAELRLLRKFAMVFGYFLPMNGLQFGKFLSIREPWWVLPSCI